MGVPLINLFGLAIEDVEELLKEHGSPLLVFSRERFIENFLLLKYCLPNVKFYYAMKSNPYIDILRTVKELGGGFDIASIGEYQMVAPLGIPKEDILYTHPIKNHNELAFMVDHGVDLFVIDNEYEIAKVAAGSPGAKIMVRVCVTNPDCVVNLGAKFGAPMNELVPLFDKCAEAGLNPIGICFHVGSQSKNPYVYVETLIELRSEINQLILKGFSPTIIDIGGGFPIPYQEPVIPISKFCEPIQAALSNFFSNFEIYAEPGRFLSGPSMILFTKVVGKSYRNGAMWYFLDDGMYGSLSGAVFDNAKYRITALKEGEPKLAVLAGPTCDSFDIISQHQLLPELEIGDILSVANVGAYTNASACKFNGFNTAKIITI